MGVNLLVPVSESCIKGLRYDPKYSEHPITTPKGRKLVLDGISMETLPDEGRTSALKKTLQDMCGACLLKNECSRKPSLAETFKPAEGTDFNKVLFITRREE